MGHRAKDGRRCNEKDRIVSLNSFSFVKTRPQQLKRELAWGMERHQLMVITNG